MIWNDFLFGATFTFGNEAPIQVALNNMVLTSSSVKRYNVDMAAAIIAGFVAFHYLESSDLQLEMEKKCSTRTVFKHGKLYEKKNEHPHP